MSHAVNLGLVGYGTIAQQQHVPAISITPAVTLTAVASPGAAVAGVRNYPDIDAMLEAEQNLDAVVLCQPPQLRYAAARAALLAGKHVFMEKPPGITLSEVEALIALAKEKQLTLFAGWHSRHAACVGQAKAWIAQRSLKSVRIVWKEDVRRWHPGQAWIWQAGGFGVLDPGINALSILTEILTDHVILRHATLEIPANRQMPIAAHLTMETVTGIPISAEFDWRQEGPQSWDVFLEAEDGDAALRHGGNQFSASGQTLAADKEAEYPSLYAKFVTLIAQRQSDADLAPLRLVADSFLCAELISTDAFFDQ